MTGKRAAALLTTTLLLPALAAAPARAQVGLGAERYEVTISPPKRPGTEAPVDAEGEAAPQAEPASAGATAPQAGGTAPAASAGAAVVAAPAAPTPASSTAPAATSAPASAPAPAAAAPAVAAKADPSLPLKTLQVGAFRQKDSATDLRDALAGTFHDVAVVEVQSGGEPLYRVTVGRQPRGPALDDLKRRLAAAGHPAFEVPAPPASGSR